GPLSEDIKEIVDTMLKDFEEAMDDDLNISPAIGAVFEGIKKIQRIQRITPVSDPSAKLIEKGLHSADSVLGVIFTPGEKEAQVDKAYILQKIAERNAARANKDWTLADKIRDELDAMGVELLDRKDGTGYKIKS
ncbi:MAG: cysteine--tRNA ligase, partial [Candidatus Marinimicrobia bacterium]|nr:cysteine--tRNA ligase [Candidatus Neomarinimicrobiota bacterium]